MRVIVGCEYSGVVRESFRSKGHDAWSCDLLPSEDDSPYHIQGNVLDILNDGWNLGIFHPSCTRLCNSGVCWLTKRNLWAEMKEGAALFKALLNAPIPEICLENPIPHKYALAEIGQKYTQIIQPWQFGHGETKATCLWLKNLPKLIPTNIVEGREARIHKMPPSENRWKERSRTYKGVAEAMAEQWG